MGPKEKQIKKANKSKKKEQPLLEDPPSEYDTMDGFMLQEAIELLSQQLNKVQVDRNYVQHERDMIDSFYAITTQERQDIDDQLIGKDRAMEIMEDNHRVEVGVYAQKVKHLAYEQKHKLGRVQTDGLNHLVEERDLHEHKETVLRSTKQALKLERQEQALSNEAEIQQLTRAHEKNVTKLREQLETNQNALEGQYQQRLRDLHASLELQHKVETHEVEERKNRHIYDLIKHHDIALTQMKTYYNALTRDNVRLIDSLKNEIAALKTNAAATSNLRDTISQANKRLMEPLAAASTEVEQLRHAVKDAPKDHLSLRNAKARLLDRTRQVHDLTQRHCALTRTYTTMQVERKTWLATFNDTVKIVYTKSESKNQRLEQRLASMDDLHARKRVQLQEILQAAQLDAVEAHRITETLKTVLDAKNHQIRSLQYHVAKESKAYNDTLRTFTQKLVQFGIPSEEIQALGFALLAVNVSVAPAGLVALE